MHVLWETDRWLQKYSVTSGDKSAAAVSNSDMGETEVLSGLGSGKGGLEKETLHSAWRSLL